MPAGPALSGPLDTQQAMSGPLDTHLVRSRGPRARPSEDWNDECGFLWSSGHEKFEARIVHLTLLGFGN